MVATLKVCAYVFLVMGILSCLYCIWTGSIQGSYDPGPMYAKIYYSAGVSSLFSGILSFLLFHSQSTILARTDLLMKEAGKVKTSNSL